MGDARITADADLDKLRPGVQVPRATLFLCFMIMLIWVTVPAVSGQIIDPFLVLFVHYNEELGRLSRYLIRKYVLGFQNNDSSRLHVLVACPACSHVYKYEDCFKDNLPRQCTRRTKIRNKADAVCGSELLKKTKNKKKQTFVPIKRFVVTSLKQQIRLLYLRPGFQQLTEHWRTRLPLQGKAWQDVYDGTMWQKFQEYEGRPFLSEPNNLAFMLHLDWFQPFDNVSYSLGVVYLVCLNLPLDIRGKRENTIPIAALPGGREKLQNVSRLLCPLVADLMDLWKDGIHVTVHGHTDKVLVKAALILVSCDLPAGRKVTGHIGNNTCCSRCQRDFRVDSFYTEHQERLRSNGRKPGPPRGNPSGWNYEEWQTRDAGTFKASVMKTLNTHNPTKRLEVEMKLRARYSALIELPYFDPIHMLVIDPMHCWLLGVLRHVLIVFLNHDCMTVSQLVRVDKKLEKISLPRKVGRFRNKLSLVTSWKAAEVKNFTLFLSRWAFEDILEKKYYALWCDLVNVTEHLYKGVVSEQDLDYGFTCLVSAQQQFETLFGYEQVKFNQHYAFHMCEDIRMFGCFYVYHCFASERLNGILQKVKNDNREPHVTMMRAMCDYQDLMYYEYYQDHLKLSDKERKIARLIMKKFPLPERSFATSRPRGYMQLWYQWAFEGVHVNGSEDVKGGLLNPLPDGIEHSMRQSLLKYVQKTCYPNNCFGVRMCTEKEVQKSKRLSVFGTTFGSVHWNAGINANIMARFELRENGESVGWFWFIGQVQYYLSAVIEPIRDSVDGDFVKKSHYFAVVKWYKSSGNPPTQVSDFQLHRTLPDLNLNDCFVPIQKLACIVLLLPTIRGYLRVSALPDVLTYTHYDDPYAFRDLDSTTVVDDVTRLITT